MTTFLNFRAVIISSERVEQGHMTTFLNFRAVIISSERVEQDTSNLCADLLQSVLMYA